MRSVVNFIAFQIGAQALGGTRRVTLSPQQGFFRKR